MDFLLWRKEQKIRAQGLCLEYEQGQSPEENSRGTILPYPSLSDQFFSTLFVEHLLSHFCVTCGSRKQDGDTAFHKIKQKGTKTTCFFRSLARKCTRKGAETFSTAQRQASINTAEP